MSVIERFLSKVLEDKNNCWEWVATKDKDGYGIFTIGGKNYKSHRVAFAISRGFYPTDKLCVCHHCDNPSCVNPDHLYLATQKTNIKHAIERGRKSHKGERNGRARLTTKDVLEIRRLWSDGIGSEMLEVKYNISPRHVFKIISRECWKHI